MTNLTQLESALRERNRLHGLTVDLLRLRRALRLTFEGTPQARGTVLIVGIGHGLDVLAALMEGWVGAAVGIDPYHADDGNDEGDFRVLLELARDLGLENRLTVRRQTVQSYLLETPEARFDAVLCQHVLHHIFVTREALARSAMRGEAIDLFRLLHTATRDDGALIVGESCRLGLRPMLAGLGLKLNAVNYATKQQWGQWDRVIQDAGWQRRMLKNYVPYAARHASPLLGGALGRALLCDNYTLFYRKA